MLFISNQTTKFSKIFRESLQQSEKVDIAVAYAKAKGIEILKFFNRQVNAKIRIITGSDWLISDIKKLAGSGFEYRVYPKGGFHPKIYIFHLKKGGKRVVVGSSNLTEDGLWMNVESNLVFDSGEEPEVCGEVVKLFEELWEKSEEWTPEKVDHYDEKRRKVEITEGLG